MGHPRAEGRPQGSDIETEREAERLRPAMVRAFVIGAAIFPGFLLLELPLLPEHPDVPWTWPAVWRLFGSLVFLVGALVLQRRRFALRPMLAFGSFVLAGSAAAAACSSWRLGGFESHISDGMAFYFVGVATLMPASLGRALGLMIPTYITYFGLITALEAIGQPGSAGPSGVASGSGPFAIGVGFAYDLIIQLGVCLFAATGAHILWTSRQQLYRARRLGNYRLETLISRGAASEIWRATEHVKGHVARPVALKIMRIEHDLDANLLGRFEREARAASALTSEHTIRLYDYGASDDGLAFIAMEALEGVDLESLVHASGPIPPRRAIHFARQIASSLVEAHRRGIAHGDVKPSNLFVLEPGAAGTGSAATGTTVSGPARDSSPRLAMPPVHFDRLKVLDWGVARDFWWRLPTVTHEGISVGTPAVMAPEAFTGAIGPRSDIYAFGASLYFLLTGRYPIEFEPGEGPWSAHTRAHIEAPSIVKNQLFPAGLDMLVLQCLAKEPENRPGDMSLVLALLAAIPAEPWSAREADEAWATHLATRAAGATSDAADTGGLDLAERAINPGATSGAPGR